MPGAAGRCEGHHRSIHRCDHWVVGETVETPEELGGNPDPDPDPSLRSLFQQRFDRRSQELVGRRVVPVQA